MKLMHMKVLMAWIAQPTSSLSERRNERCCSIYRAKNAGDQLCQPLGLGAAAPAPVFMCPANQLQSNMVVVQKVNH